MKSLSTSCRNAAVIALIVGVSSMVSSTFDKSQSSSSLFFLKTVEAVNVKEMVGGSGSDSGGHRKPGDDKVHNDDNQQCGLYLAVSSTSTAEAPKLGVFAGTSTPCLTLFVAAYFTIAVGLHCKTLYIILFLLFARTDRCGNTKHKDGMMFIFPDTYHPDFIFSLIVLRQTKYIQGKISRREDRSVRVT